MALKEYIRKRDFSKTEEPEGEGKGKKRDRGSGRKRERKNPVFVVQKHDASSLHYDFRLEISGVLKSWAVPKGPSMNPKDKRLAIMTEDHPLDYADFEGVIPEGQYGAGTVMVWDKGTYDNISEKDGKEISAESALEKGHLTFELSGKKLKGAFTLIKTKREGQWLLMKKKDDHAMKKDILESEKKSVKSGKKMKGIEKEYK
ncbi:MAG: DNA polymerase ligase N-terminal domain-containing protein [Candidatus Woesearchaeota archaeon]